MVPATSTEKRGFRPRFQSDSEKMRWKEEKDTDFDGTHTIRFSEAPYLNARARAGPPIRLRLSPQFNGRAFHKWGKPTHWGNYKRLSHTFPLPLLRNYLPQGEEYTQQVVCEKIYYMCTTT